MCFGTGNVTRMSACNNCNWKSTLGLFWSIKVTKCRQYHGNKNCSNQEPCLSYVGNSKTKVKETKRCEACNGTGKRFR